MAIRDPLTVLDYVRAFCRSLQGELGAFRLIDAGSRFTVLPRLLPRDMRPRVALMAGGHFAVSGYVTYAGDLFRAELEVAPDGAVTMTDSELVGHMTPAT